MSKQTGKKPITKSATYPRLLNYGRGLIREDQLLSLTPLNAPTAKGFEFIATLVNDQMLWLRRADAEALYTALTGRAYQAEPAETEEEAGV